jgi:hypothetical protein
LIYADVDSAFVHKNNGTREDYEKPERNMILPFSLVVLPSASPVETMGKSKDKKWWMELRRNRVNEIQVEAGGAEPVNETKFASNKSL